ncbi:hypothetical protein PMAYCL1PPCAC_11521, partial [Pristionchus mayeri]
RHLFASLVSSIISLSSSSQMVVQLCPLAIRPELYITDERPPYGPLNAFIYTKSKPHVLLTSKKCCRRQREISLWIEGVAGQDTRNFHYAGSFNQAMYFYREKNSDFEPDLLIEWNVVNMRMQGIRAAEHPNVLFFHRQPYYLIRTGPEICQIRHFELHRPPINVNYKPLPLKNPMLLYKDGTLFILRKGSDERLLEASKNIVDIQHPLLNNECTAFVDADEPVIYVSLHSNAKLMIINAKSFGIQIVELGLGVDIRYASRGLLIFAEVFHTAPYTNLSFGQLEDRYWKVAKSLFNDTISLMYISANFESRKTTHQRPGQFASVRNLWDGQARIGE